MAMSAGSRQQGAGSYRLQQAGWPGREHYVAAAVEQDFWSAVSLKLSFVDYKGATGLRMDPEAVGAVLCIKGRRAGRPRRLQLCCREAAGQPSSVAAAPAAAEVLCPSCRRRRHHHTRPQPAPAAPSWPWALTPAPRWCGTCATAPKSPGSWCLARTRPGTAASKRPTPPSVLQSSVGGAWGAEGRLLALVACRRVWPAV
jgi:hypothetical protein